MAIQAMMASRMHSLGLWLKRIRLHLWKGFLSLLTLISPMLNTKILYWWSLKRPLNLKYPSTFNEKILWLKFNTYYMNPLVIKCADKYAVREYVRSCGCGEILNTLYGVYRDVEEIPWDSLPEKFVIKWNFGCGMNIVCPDKDRLDIPRAARLLSKWGKARAHLPFSEMQYKYIKPLLICEKYIEPEHGALPDDYKVYCFNGTPEYVMICIGRGTGSPAFHYFDKRWNLFRAGGEVIPEDFVFPKPKGMDELFRYAGMLSGPFPFVRADFYLNDGNITFGEFTFTPSGGFDASTPTGDLVFGRMIRLPEPVRSGRQAPLSGTFEAPAQGPHGVKRGIGQNMRNQG